MPSVGARPRHSCFTRIRQSASSAVGANRTLVTQQMGAGRCYGILIRIGMGCDCDVTTVTIISADKPLIEDDISRLVSWYTVDVAVA